MTKQPSSKQPKPKPQKPLTKLIGCGAEPNEIYTCWWHYEYNYTPAKYTPIFIPSVSTYIGRKIQHYKGRNPLISTCRKCSHQQRRHACGDYKPGRKYLCDTCLKLNGIVW